MADSFTANLNLTKPEPGASIDTWGGKLNTDLDTLDAIFKADGTGTSTGLNVGSGRTLTLGGTLAAFGTNVTARTGTGNLVLSAAPTFTGTVSGASASFSGVLRAGGAASYSNLTVQQAANVTLGVGSSYGLSLHDGANPALSLGYGASDAYLQSWGGKTLHLNNQGNDVLVGGTLRCTSPVIAGTPVINTGADSATRIGSTANYNMLSMNGTVSLSTGLGLAAGASGNNNLYAILPSGGLFAVNINGSNSFAMGATDATYATSNNGVSSFTISNASSGASASARVYLGTNLSGARGRLLHWGGGFSTSGVYRQDGLTLESTGAGGVTLHADAGSVYVGVAGTVEATVAAASASFRGALTAGSASQQGTISSDGPAGVGQGGLLALKYGGTTKAYLGIDTAITGSGNSNDVTLYSGNGKVWLMANGARKFAISDAGTPTIYANAGTGILANSDGGNEIRWSNGQLYPNPDNAVNLGSSSLRWGTVYAATGSINTSDAREKDWRGSLSPAELRASAAILGEIGIFRFLSAIGGKGEAARLHVGLKAQTVRDILSAQGLDARAYAFLCHDRWDASDEAPAGDRWGLRPDELSFFLLAGLHQRLAALENL